MPEASSLPVIDISDLGTDLNAQPTDEAWLKVGRTLAEGLKETGFVYLKGHGIPQQQIERISKASAEFFDLPEELKEKFSFNPDTKEGYIAVDRQRNGRNKNAKELRESYDLKKLDGLPSQEESPDFKDSIEVFLESCRKLSNRILIAIAVGLNLDPKFFLDAHKDTNDLDKTPNVLRLLYYPPVPADMKTDALRIAAHNDWGTITFLFQDNVGGLDVKHKSGDWIKAHPMPGVILLNIGELLQFWTSDILQAAEHRVLVPDEETLKRKCRRSIAYFVNPDRHALIRPIDGSSDKKPILSKDFILSKYKETFQY